MAIAGSFLSVMTPKLDNPSGFRSSVQKAIDSLEPADKYAQKKLTQLIEYIDSISASRSVTLM